MRGEEIAFHLAKTVRNIAGRIQDMTADAADAAALRRLADALEGTGRQFSLKVHLKRGQPAFGSAGVDRRLKMAQEVKAYKDEHGCTNAVAYEALSGQFNNVGPETFKKAWQEMSPLLDMPENDRNLLLKFKRLEARGFAKVTKVKG